MNSTTVGAQLGPYRVGRLLGAGGMGEVYLGRDVRLGRDVAIKFLTAADATTDRLKGRLLQEARAVAALEHPGICPVYDVGVDSDGRAYMVLQYVEGETLATKLQRGPLPAREAVRLCAQIAEALAAAHAHGIVHRDLKPQNVIVTPGGVPKLLDFGIAKFAPDADSLETRTDTGLPGTDTPRLAGTPGYMSPEQLQQGDVDGRSDLFSLGAMLFECLTGRRAFDGPHAIEVLGQILHVHPPPPSELRPELDPRLDELCRRLLAKDPADRFQSAHEVVGAIRILQPDTARTDAKSADREHAGTRPPPPSHWRRHAVRYALAAVVVAIAAVAGFRWPRAVPAPPPDAAGYYERGTEALREGAFHSASLALNEAIRLFPAYPAAYARLAEARAEIDDEGGAREALVRLSQHAPNQARLPEDERLRLSAIRASVLREVDEAVRGYRQLAERRPTDAGRWLDLGRAQESAGLLADARATYQGAVAADGQYAAAYLRLGNIEALDGRHEEAMKAYAEAERLYQVSSNTEGEAEVLIRRGALLDIAGEFVQARASLEAGLVKAQAIKNAFQIVRAQMSLSSVTASEGRSRDAERQASAAVETALAAGLETAAADGLIDLAATLVEAGRHGDAQAHLVRAGELARKRGARRIEARAQLQMASLHADQRRPVEALNMLEPALEFFRQHKYRHFELTALSIASRAHQQRDDIARAHAMSLEALKVAEELRNDVQVGLALGNLAHQATSVGSLPEALGLRERAEAIHRRQGDLVQLPFDLTNRAELLIRLGRESDAHAALSEVEDGIAKGNQVYVGRQRRVTFLRLLAAAIGGRFDAAVSLGSRVAPEPKGTDAASVLTSALVGFAEAKLGRPARAERLTEGGSPAPQAFARERQYWSALAFVVRGRASDALAAASKGLDQVASGSNDEIEWRLAAIASVAAGVLERGEEQRTLRTRAAASLNRLRASWGAHVRAYEDRPDLKELRRNAQL